MKALKWILGALALAVAAFGGILWDAHHRAAATFERHTKEVEGLIAEIRRRPFEGRFVPGDAVPGLGWADFARALEALGNPITIDKKFLMNFDRDKGFLADPERIDAFLARRAGDVEYLRDTLRSPRLDPGYAYEKGRALFDQPNSSHASRVLAGSAIRRHEQGRDREAFDLLLLHFAKGLALEAGGGRNQLGHRVWSETEGAYYWTKFLARHSLSTKDLAELAAELDRLEARRPDAREALRVDDVFDRMRLLRWERDGDDSGFTIEVPSWRCFYSRSLARAAALNEVERYYRDLDDIRPGNPYVDAVLAPVNSMLEYHAQVRPVWTAMREATARAWYEAEKGAPPASRDVLVPRYLPR